MDDLKPGNAAIIDAGSDQERRAFERQPSSSRQSSRPPSKSDHEAPADDGRGRSAEKPSDIPARGCELPPEKSTPGYAAFASACSGVM
jgi:hypothetical protein